MAKVLGKKVQSYSKASSKSLDPIDRGHRPQQNGVDYWNAYEFTFLDKNKVPVLKVLEIQIPSTSKFTVESKSLKIYLNSFYKKQFSKDSEVLDKVKKDLNKLTKSDVKAKFITKFSESPDCINLNTLRAVNTNPNQVYCFIGFRSICPVTSQPDFANIYVTSGSVLNTSWLIKYFKSYAERGDFHEHCVESMFEDIQNQFRCASLEISGRFMRRGGIDINPTRSSSKKLFFKNFRFFNQ